MGLNVKKTNIKFLIIGMLTLSIVGCGNIAGMALQRSGIGVTSEDEIATATSTQFGVEKSVITISDIQRKDLLTGQEIYYNAILKGKTYRCYMKTAVAGHDRPICAKQGDPLNIPRS